jgi:tetratricopeptide (TPR) repeat protein
MKSFRKDMKAWIVTGLFSVSIAASACVNDRDTIAFEKRNIDAITEFKKAKNEEDRARFASNIALKAIGGQFDRFPTKYYEMRIARLKAKPSLTAAEYDDLAVAQDRLGQVDTAIKTILESQKVRKTTDDQYRFHANYGTFLVHRWVKEGKGKSDLATLEKSIAEIEKAVKINPDSHFGREKYQLHLEKEWLKFHQGKPTGRRYGTFSMKESTEAIVGFSGIIMMGLGYQLPDVYLKTSEAAQSGQHESTKRMLMDFAQTRAKQLIREGHKLVGMKPQDGLYQEPDKYGDLMKKGETAQAEREKFMNERMSRSEHPDTHPEFWKGWTEPMRPVTVPVTDPVKVPVTGPVSGTVPVSGSQYQRADKEKLYASIVGVLAAPVVIWGVVRRVRRR